MQVLHVYLFPVPEIRKKNFFAGSGVGGGAQVQHQIQQWARLVGCFGFIGPLRQYFSLYPAVSQKEGERGGEKG